MTYSLTRVFFGGSGSSTIGTSFVEIDSSVTIVSFLSSLFFDQGHFCPQSLFCDRGPFRSHILFYHHYFVFR